VALLLAQGASAIAPGGIATELLHLRPTAWPNLWAHPEPKTEPAQVAVRPTWFGHTHIERSSATMTVITETLLPICTGKADQISRKTCSRSTK
jgi:hypothetical protein